MYAVIDVDRRELHFDRSVQMGEGMQQHGGVESAAERDQQLVSLGAAEFPGESGGEVLLAEAPSGPVHPD